MTRPDDIALMHQGFVNSTELGDNAPPRSAPQYPRYFDPYDAIRPLRTYTFHDIREQIGIALHDGTFSNWTFTYDEYDVSWCATYVDLDRLDEYGEAPYNLYVTISLYYDNQTNNHVIHVNAVQRNGEIGIAEPFISHLQHYIV